jgi:hypothetical protein
MRARDHLVEVRAPGGSCEHKKAQEQNPYKPEGLSGIMKERPVATLAIDSHN